MRIFLLGMSGIGMQALAKIAQQSGYEVSGNDDSLPIQALIESGITYQNTIPEDTDYIVYSSAIKESHPLMITARERNIPCINRTDFLTDYIQFNPQKILIAGAHGKTTTTCMLAYILGMKSYAIGGMVNGYKFSGNNELDEFTAIETDESDGSFIKWKGSYKILLNADYEHMDFFETEVNALKYYRNFAIRDIETTKLIIEAECKKFLALENHPNMIIYAENGKHDCHFSYSNITCKPDGLYFDIINHIAKLTLPIFLPLFGKHNASNFTALYALHANLGMTHEEIATKIAKFPGAKKRMYKIKTENGFNLYLDYGHHPKEVAAVLNAVWEHKKTRPNVVLEPHRYSRLQYTWQQWPEALKGNKVFVVPIHTASEIPIEGITRENFVKFLRENNVDAHLLEDFNQYKMDNETICFSAGKLSAMLEKLVKTR